MDGLRVAVAELAHALGGAARGGGEQNVQSHALEERDDGAHARRLARAGTAGQQQQFFLCRELDSLTLERRVLHALLALDFFDDALDAAQGVGLVREHRLDARDNIGLVLPRLTQIAGRHVRDTLLHDAVDGDEIVEAFFHRVDIAVQKLGRRGERAFRAGGRRVRPPRGCGKARRCSPASVRSDASPPKPIESAISSQTEKSTPNALSDSKYGLRSSAAMAFAPKRR